MSAGVCRLVSSGSGVANGGGEKSEEMGSNDGAIKRDHIEPQLTGRNGFNGGYWQRGVIL